jgi:FAD/FMN-containing dehydrogenase/Fe-S oxidoreductase
MINEIQAELDRLAQTLDGELHTGQTVRVMYATDASVYEELPIAVAYPKTDGDIQKLICWADANRIPLISRTAGTSLAGQVVGAGIIVDFSRYYTQIIEISVEEGWVRVQPGVIRNELNMALKQYGLFFAPETSTQNRAMIGGMFGNNSCGSNSIVYGSTRDHVIESKGFLSDGSAVHFHEMSAETLKLFLAGEADTLERRIYASLLNTLSRMDVQDAIEREFPDPEIHRRNQGYAVDLLLRQQPFSPKANPLNLCTLLAGSEGTLFMATELKLRCSRLPPPVRILLCGHFDSLESALKANESILIHPIWASELIDHYILECTERNIEQRKNRFFVKGNPAALLVVEFRGDTLEEVHAQAAAVVKEWRDQNLGFAYPTIEGGDCEKVWELRKAGLGVLSNIPGDAKPVAVIEDTAVNPLNLQSYVNELDAFLQTMNLPCVHYGHAGAGELHLRPILNLKDPEDVRRFRQVAEGVAKIVKKYRGSLSGEHGDGRLRGEFLEKMLGAENLALFRQIKQCWDPKGIFNPGKITDVPPMDRYLRYEGKENSKDFPKTTFHFRQSLGLLRAVEQCNGSGDCRKTHLSGGTMCPSYMATRDEKDTTRARANLLRYYLTRIDRLNPFANKGIREALSTCLACKGCHSECPSNVDMARIKAEFMQYFHDADCIQVRTWLIAHYPIWMKWMHRMPKLSLFLLRQKPFKALLQHILGFDTKRNLPEVSEFNFYKWFAAHQKQRGSKPKSCKRTVHLFMDEFLCFQEPELAVKAVELLEALGVWVIPTEPMISGRTYLSMGMVRKAKLYAQNNVSRLSSIISVDEPLIGLEPSSLLSFRDEYPDLCDDKLLGPSEWLSESSFLIEEYLSKLLGEEPHLRAAFRSISQKIVVHGHCHQKALSSMQPVRSILECIPGATVQILNTGCCGMAGAFGYQKENAALSRKIGELVLLPAVRAESSETLIIASGTSCRQQISDETTRIALHPIEVLHAALKPVTERMVNGVE